MRSARTNLQLGSAVIHKNDSVDFVIDKTPAECFQFVKDKKPIIDYKGNHIEINNIKTIYPQYFKDNKPLL